MVSIHGMWGDAADDDARITWVRETWDEFATHGTGTTYANFSGQREESATELAESAFGQNLGRLRRLKSTYDPENFFDLNANILPG